MNAEEAAANQKRIFNQDFDIAIEEFKIWKAKKALEAEKAEQRKLKKIAEVYSGIAEQKRLAGADHRRRVNNEILVALVLKIIVLSEEDAKKIVIAINRGEIPHVKIEY